MTIATSYEQVTYNSPDGAQVGKAATEKVAFYGATPVVQRASSLQATSVISGISTGAVSTNSILLNTVVEIMNTLNGLGVWKGTA